MNVVAVQHGIERERRAQGKPANRDPLTDHRCHFQALNLGNGNGFSVREVIDTASSVTGIQVPMRIQDRRPGDPARLVADATRAKADLGWVPRYPDLAAIIGDAWQWEQRLAATGGKPGKGKTP